MTLVPIQHAAIDVQLAYATTENFAGEVLYTTPEDRQARLHRHAADALFHAADRAAALGLRFLLLDAYRPQAVQRRLWEVRPDPEFVADPEIGSDHSRGTAVDLTLTRADGTVLDMGTDFDAALQQSHHSRIDIHREAQQNRLILLGLMVGAGFEMNPYEWWHYALENSENYPLL